TSQGKQKGNSINIDDSQLPAEVNVKYYYPASFLKPKMLPVVGSSSWKYGTGGTGTDIVITNAVITDFTMSATQITQAQYEYVFPDRGGLNSSAGGNNFACSTDPDYSPSSSKPAEMINWYAAIAYCNKLSKKESKKPCYSVTVSGVEVDWANLTYANIPGNSTNNADWDAATCDFTADGYRLPTEWEWEYAARGGTNVREWEYSGSAAIGGSADISDIAWYWDNVGHTAGNADYGTHPVGALAANDLGLYDMSGNVYEWCWNWDNAIYDGSSSGTPFSTPTGNAVGSGGGSSSRVLRGGGWSDDVSGCRVSRRFKHTPYYRGNGSGFRVVCR
ncbi:MAG: formylglycine-generating enzyme family protein, partial [Dysgonamonadaceae bacterium]|nr:formylglycine-generating enzyme family protein [Dysgonamonadaceae bacterium]